MGDLERLSRCHRLFVTTYGSAGRSSTVPVWFTVHEGKVYFTTQKASLKARRIRRNPRVTLRFGSPRAPAFEGRAAWAEPSAYDVILPAYRRKYWYIWWLMGRVIRRRRDDGTSTAVEVALLDGRGDGEPCS